VIHLVSSRPSDRAPGVEVTDEGSRTFVEVVAEALGLAKLQVIDTGGDVYQSERQQWDSGNNAVALEPGVVFTYDRNTLLRRRAWRSSPSSAPSSAAAGAAATA
jgi:arginine deiminase